MEWGEPTRLSSLPIPNVWNFNFYCNEIDASVFGLKKETF